MKFDTYTLVARICPAIICSIPFLVLYYFFLSIHLEPFFELLLGAKWPGDISTALVFLLLLAYLGRAIAKDLFENQLFKQDETYMPTTEFLLHSNNEYSDDFKKKVHEKIRADFDIRLFSAEEENDDQNRARKLIAEAVTFIRNKLREGGLVLQHNTEYGFIRNLVGCAVIAILVSIINVVVFWLIDPNKVALSVSIVLLALYVLPIMLGKVMIRAHGRRYGRTLIQEYVSDIWNSS